MISISSAILLSIIIPITYVKRQERIKKLEAIYSDGCGDVKVDVKLKKKSELLDLIGYAYAICFISIL